MTIASSSDSKSAAGEGFRRKLIVLVLLMGVILVGYVQLSDALTLQTLADQESRLRGLQREHPLLTYGIAFLIYVGVTGLSLPGATAMTLAYGWFFGLVRAVLLVSFASTTGATLAFLLSRYLFREAMQSRFHERLIRFNDALRKDGAFFLFTLRLILVVPFVVINIVMGLTPIRTTTFWWVSQLGMLPGTIIYVYAGSSVPNLQTLADKEIGAVFSSEQLVQILIAFALLGLFPLVVRRTLRYFGIAASTKDRKLKAKETTKL